MYLIVDKHRARAIRSTIRTPSHAAANIRYIHSWLGLHGVDGDGADLIVIRYKAISYIARAGGVALRTLL